MTDKQRQIIHKLIELLLETKYLISVWTGTIYALEDSSKIDDVLAAIEQLNDFASIEIDLPYQTGGHDPYLGNIDLTWSTTKPNIGITYDVKPAIESIIDQVKNFADSLLAAEATS